MANRSIFYCIILMTISREILAIKCWRCTSKLKFCGDVLDQKNLTASQLDWYFNPCGSVRKKVDYKGDKIISKCHIRIDIAYDKLVYTRKCVEEAEVASPNSCLTDESFNDNDDPNVRLMSCETCTEYGCNLKIDNYFTTDYVFGHINEAEITRDNFTSIDRLRKHLISRLDRQCKVADEKSKLFERRSMNAQLN